MMSTTQVVTAADGSETKTSTFRQSGWKEVATSVVHIYYGTDAPPADGSFIKIWDNNVTVVSKSVPVGP